MIERDEALNLVRKHMRNDKLIKHVLAVEAIMKGLAKRLGYDEKLWSLVGLLHDLDYEKTINDMSRHGLLTAEIVKDILPSEAVEAIKAHNELTGVISESPLAIALKAADQISGLIVATALVMPNKKLSEVKVKSVMKKFKQKDFARNIKREKIRLIEKLGIPLEEFVELSLTSLLEISDVLGL